MKHDPTFPHQAIKFCLHYSGLNLHSLDAIVFYDKPFLKFERLLETYYDNAPRGLSSFVKSMPVWLKEKVFLRKVLAEELKRIDPSFSLGKVKILFTEHHLSHAASAFFASPYHEAAILTIDGVGEWATAAIGFGKGEEIKFLKELHFPHSMGLLYSSFTYFLGFKVNSGEYKMMGLAPYGNRGDTQTERFIRLIKDNIVTIFGDGSIRLNEVYFNYSTGLTMIHRSKWEKLFDVALRNPAEPLKQVHCNLALAIQTISEEIVLLMATHACQITGSKYLCFAGGVALNSVANGKLKKSRLFDDIFIQPAAGDAGGALGAAWAANHIYFNQERILSSRDKMQNASLGPQYSDGEIEKTVRKHKAIYKRYASEEALLDEVVQKLVEGNIVGWFSGRMEFGPRALGCRSIFGNPLIADMQNRMNQKIKFREGFRPFAAITLEEDAPSYFDLEGNSPFMLLVSQIQKEHQLPLPVNFSSLSMEEKLNTPKSVLPAITHVDLSCRVQTVAKHDNATLWRLLTKFKAKTKFSVLINTSFNVRGEPIVCSPDEAYAGFMHTGMDILVLENFLFEKKHQPEMRETAQIINYINSD